MVCSLGSPLKRAFVVSNYLHAISRLLTPAGDRPINQRALPHHLPRRHTTCSRTNQSRTSSTNQRAALRRAGLVPISFFLTQRSDIKQRSPFHLLTFQAALVWGRSLEGVARSSFSRLLNKSLFSHSLIIRCNLSC